MRSGWVMAVALVALGAGCAEREAAPERVVAGDVAWKRPVSEGLVVQVRSDAGLHTLVSFDRSSWYVAGLERVIGEEGARRTTVRGVDVGRFEEVAAVDVVDPGELARFRYDRVEARATARGEPFDLRALDAEWTARLADLAAAEAAAAAGAGEVDAGLPPVGALP